jgi:hypothetical protein
MTTPPKAASGTTPQRALAVAALAAGGVLAIYAMVSVSSHVLREVRLRRAIREAMAEAEAPAVAVVVPSPPAPVTAASKRRSVTMLRLSACELARQSLPAASAPLPREHRQRLLRGAGPGAHEARAAPVGEKIRP